MTSPSLELVVAPDKPEITTRRQVNAPRDLVFAVFSKPEHLQRWMGPRAFPMVSCACDFRVGGRFRFVYQGPNGQPFAFNGEFRDIVAPERIVRTFVFEAFPDDGSVETFTFEARGATTVVHTLTVHKTMAARDGHLQHGMEAGMTEGYARLDELVAQLT